MSALITALQLASYLGFPVLLIWALRRRNDTPAVDRAHGVVYLTLAVAAVQVLPWLSAQMTGEPPTIVMGGIDLWPVYAALGVAVVVVLLKHGTRIQRDTDGLV